MNLAAFQAGLQGLQAFNQLGASAAGYISGRKTDQSLKAYGQMVSEETSRQGRALLGQQRAAFAKSGVDPGTGTAALLQSRQRELNDLEARRAKYGVDLQRFRLNQQGTLGLASGVADAGFSLGKGVLDYYQNKKP